MQRFRWAAAVSEAAAEDAQQLREQDSQEEQIAVQLAERLGRTGRTLESGFVVESLYCPVEGAVGGDFIASLVLGPDTLAMIVGDVTGHGLAAALDAMRLKDLLLVDLAQHSSPAGALAAGNTHLHARADVLATVFIGIVSANELRYASAGHLPGLLVGGTGAHRALPSTGTILGAGADLDLDEITVSLGDGDAVVVYTDGLLEAFGAEGGLDPSDIAAVVRRGEFFELKHRVRDLDHLPLRDDIAALLVRADTGGRRGPLAQVQGPT